MALTTVGAIVLTLVGAILIHVGAMRDRTDTGRGLAPTIDVIVSSPNLQTLFIFV